MQTRRTRASQYDPPVYFYIRPSTRGSLLVIFYDGIGNYTELTRSLCFIGRNQEECPAKRRAILQRMPRSILRFSRESIQNYEDPQDAELSPPFAMLSRTLSIRDLDTGLLISFRGRAGQSKPRSIKALMSAESKDG